MKRISLVFALLLFLIPGFWSCQKEDLGNLDAIFSDTAQNGAVAVMSAKINGMPWSAAYYDITLQPGKPGEILITGESEDGKIISLDVANTAAGDYLLSRISAHVASYAPDSVTTSYYNSNTNLASGGVVNIDAIDSVKFTMSGQFNFIGTRADGSMATITDGVFTNLDYTNISLNTQFSAKYNGNVWNPKTVTTAVTSGAKANVLTITASNEDGTQINLVMPENITARKAAYSLTSTGQYRANFIENNFTLIPYVASTYNSPKTPCTLKITSNDTQNKMIQGSFSFYGVNASDLTQHGSRITGGVFNISYK